MLRGVVSHEHLGLIAPRPGQGDSVAISSQVHRDDILSRTCGCCCIAQGTLALFKGIQLGDIFIQQGL